MRLLILTIALSGCSLYFDHDHPGADDVAPDAGVAADPNTLARPCLRAMSTYDQAVGATAHPERLFITYVCEGGAIIETIAFDGTGFPDGMARGDFQDSSNRLITMPPNSTISNDILLISEHRAELWLFSYNSGQRMSFEKPFSDIWIGDVDGNGHRDFVLAGPDAVRVASAESNVYGFPLDVPASSETNVLTGKNFRYVAVANLAGDARLDLFYIAGGGTVPFEVGLAEQTGAQTFTITESHVDASASPDTSQPLRVADVDGDGKPDVVGIASQLFVWSSRYDTTLVLGEAATSIATGDIDGDHTQDILYITADKTAVRRVSVKTAGGQPVLVSAPLLAEGGDIIEAGDFDTDGSADIALIKNARQASSTLTFHRASQL